MAASTVTGILPTNDTNAHFRAWGQNVSSAFAAAGLVQASDSGQINWTTVANPAANSTYAGYEIWRFNDAFKTTSPVYIKFEYGQGATGNTPSILITVGSGSNGSGTIVGGTSTAPLSFGATQGRHKISINTANNSNTGMVSYLSGNTSRFDMRLWATGTGTTAHFMGFSIERTKDANGVNTGEGLLCSVFPAPTVLAAYQFLLDCGIGLVSTPEASLSIAAPNNVTTGVNGSNTAIYPQLFWRAGSAWSNPGTCTIGYFTGDFAAGSTQTFPIYGANHTYMPLGQTGTGTATSFKHTSIAPAMLYE